MVIFLPRGNEDEGLQGLALVLKERLRASDIAGRLDEGLLAVLMAETDEAGATAMANAVMSELAKAGLKFDFKVCVYPSRLRDPEVVRGVGAVHGREDDNDDSSGGGDVHPQKNGTLSMNGSPVYGIHEGAVHGRERAVGSAGLTRLSSSEAGASLLEPDEIGQVRAALGAGRVQDLRPLCFEPISFRRRALDVVASGGMLLILSPLLLLVALAVKLSSRGPVFYTQKRAGLGGVPFDFYKFRSMRVGADDEKADLEDSNEQNGPIFKMKNDPRMTSVGRFLRRSSLDELPQLYNVLRGDMTLVGPRPPTVDEVENYEPWQLQRLAVKGGLTCIWQVSGRSEVGFEEWVRMDLRYARRRGLGMDLGLLAKTAGAVASGRGAY